MSSSLSRLPAPAAPRPFSAAFRAQLRNRVDCGPLGRQTLAAAAAPRQASSKAGDGATPALEKPDRFRPPSHGQRLRRGGGAPPLRSYGPELSRAERAAQSRKQYPNMMPPEGSLMHWLLTNRAIHVWITMSVLTAAAGWAVRTNFKVNSPYYDLLPSATAFLWHPFASLGQVAHVYKLHTDHVTAVTAEKRRKQLDEVQKRKAYRIAHGFEKDNAATHGPEAAAGVPAVELGEEMRAGAGIVERGDAAVQEDEVRGPRRYKKWFGIW